MYKYIYIVCILAHVCIDIPSHFIDIPSHFSVPSLIFNNTPFFSLAIYNKQDPGQTIHTLAVVHRVAVCCSVLQCVEVRCSTRVCIWMCPRDIFSFCHTQRFVPVNTIFFEKNFFWTTIFLLLSRWEYIVSVVITTTPTHTRTHIQVHTRTHAFSLSHTHTHTQMNGNR